MTDLRERLAALAHQQWSGWKQYEFSKCVFNDDGTVTMPAWAVERWTRQMNTAYADLPESEKESDRKEADKVLAVIKSLCIGGSLPVQKSWTLGPSGSNDSFLAGSSIGRAHDSKP